MIGKCNDSHGHHGHSQTQRVKAEQIYERKKKQQRHLCNSRIESLPLEPDIFSLIDPFVEFQNYLYYFISFTPKATMTNLNDEVDDRLRQAGVNDDAAVAATKDDEDDTSISVVGNEINNDDDGDENNERLLQEEEDEEQRAAIAAARLRHQQRPEKQRRKLRKVLEQAENFPVRQRMKINQLVDYFLSKLEEDIYRMVTDQRIIDYRGLDSERDTEAEVETALRIFPHTLRRRKRDESGNNLTLYPIHCLSLKTDGTESQRPLYISSHDLRLN